MRTVAALYVDPKGHYPSMPGVECWDEKRDARLYAGPHPVVAHPPCGRWCRLAKFVEKRFGYRVGDDGGTFEAALASVRRWGGVLEHPAFSLAWVKYGLTRPPKSGWLRTPEGEYVCCVAQSAYGHECTKLTWILLCGFGPPQAMNWEKPKGKRTIGSYSRRIDGTVDRHDKRRLYDKRVAIHSPPLFAALLVELARNAR